MKHIYLIVIYIIFNIMNYGDDKNIILLDNHKMIKYIKNNKEVYELDILQFNVPHYNEIAKVCDKYIKEIRDKNPIVTSGFSFERRNDYLKTPCNWSYMDYNSKYNKLYITNMDYFGIEMYYKYERKEIYKKSEDMSMGGVYEIDLNTGTVKLLLNEDIYKIVVLPKEEELLLVYHNRTKYVIYNIKTKKRKDITDEVKNKTIDVSEYFGYKKEKIIILDKELKINEYWRKVDE